MSDDFVKVGELDEIARIAASAVAVADNMVALFNIDGDLFAIDDSCLRCGASVASGELRGHYATCSRCDWEYEVATGAVRGVPQLHTGRFAVKIVDTEVMVSRRPMR